MSINELQDEVIAEFSDFDDWMDRYQLGIQSKRGEVRTSLFYDMLVDLVKIL